jgi:hypothetical protein
MSSAGAVPGPEYLLAVIAETRGRATGHPRWRRVTAAGSIVVAPEPGWPASTSAPLRAGEADRPGRQSLSAPGTGNPDAGHSRSESVTCPEQSDGSAPGSPAPDAARPQSATPSPLARRAPASPAVARVRPDAEPSGLSDAPTRPDVRPATPDTSTPASARSPDLPDATSQTAPEPAGKAVRPREPRSLTDSSLGSSPESSTLASSTLASSTPAPAETGGLVPRRLTQHAIVARDGETARPRTQAESPTPPLAPVAVAVEQALDTASDATPVRSDRHEAPPRSRLMTDDEASPSVHIAHLEVIIAGAPARDTDSPRRGAESSDPEEPGLLGRDSMRGLESRRYLRRV